MPPCWSPAGMRRVGRSESGQGLDHHHHSSCGVGRRVPLDRHLGRDPVALPLHIDDEPARGSAGERARPRPHPRPRSMLIAYWWFRVRRTLISRTARPCRRISSAIARGTRKSGTGDTLISSGEDIPVAAWPTVRSHFGSGLPPLVLGLVPPPPGVVPGCGCIFAISFAPAFLRRIHHHRELLAKRVSQPSRKKAANPA